MNARNIIGIGLFFLLLVSSCKEDPFVPASLGSVVGQVFLEEDNTPIADVEISTNPPTTSIFTDAEGRFALELVSTGNYSLRLEKEGYVTSLESVAIIPDQTTNIVIKLERDEDVNEAPEIPVLIQPAEEETIDVNTTFIWRGGDKDVNDELTYSLLLFENDNTTPVRTISELTDTTYTFEDLNYGRQLYWQIIADDGQAQTFSPTGSFSTQEIPDFRYHFVKQIDNQFKIFAADNDGNEFCLSNPNDNSWRPRLSPNRDEIAFISNEGIENQIYLMNRSGANIQQLTTVPISGNENAELDFSWSPDGDKLAYMNNNKLYSIEKDGSNFTEIATAPIGWTFVECDWSYQGDRLLVRLGGQEAYNGIIYILDLQGNYLTVVQGDVSGSSGGGSWSLDGNSVLFTQDISGFESSDGRQLDSRMFIRNISTGEVTDLSIEKMEGTNDLDPRFSPDGASVIFVNTNNDGISNQNIYSIEISNPSERILLASDAFMPDWE